MNPEAQAAILKAYFDPQEGNAYSLCRTHINSCDFSLGNYAYDEVDGRYRADAFLHRTRPARADPADPRRSEAARAAA